MVESYKQLYQELRDSEFGCIPPGFHETETVYELVRNEYPDLCDDRIECRDICGTDSDQPEWKHRIRTVQQDLVRSSESRIQKLSDGWYYGPKEVGVSPMPDSTESFEVGEYYNRWELHDEFGGQRYSGISTPAEYAAVFLFTGESGESYGYEDEFLEDGTFLYSGEGAEGDMSMDGGNEAIRSHQKNNKDLHLFEDTDYPWIVNYVGQYQYAGHQWDTLEDNDGNQREAIRFRLKPLGGNKVEIDEGSPSSLSDSELFAKAKESSPTRSSDSSSTKTTTSRQTFSRSEVVREFALRDADGICQGCNEEAPFIGEHGEPYLEVHHLHRRSDGGTDDPENVIALCPNCHRRVHHGKDGKKFNQQLIEIAQERNRRYR